MGVLKYPHVRMYWQAATRIPAIEVKLLLELKEIGILASGTIRGKRLAGCVLKTDKEMKKEGRESYDERVSVDGDVALVRWQDNGVVNMASTHLRVGNVGANDCFCLFHTK
ncbi:hypothetical protein MRX96_011769 [Rhipicephalus microplus]